MQESKIYSRPRLCFSKKQSTTNQNNNKNKNFVINIITITIVAIVTFYGITQAINPIINDMCIDKAKNIATQVANEEATNIMDKYSYEDLITIIRDNEGNIKMLQTNTKNVNQIMSDIPVNIINRFNEKDNSDIYIYSGSILGIKLFSASGPKIHIKIANVGNVDTKLESEFKSQGINQTLHRIYLLLTCEVTILTPYNTIRQKIDNQVLIAESVIVGTVPDFYYNGTNWYIYVY